MSFTVISLFAGCGGSSTGYVMAGGKVLLAVEWDDNAVATYKANYPDTPVYHGDIGKLTIDEILKTTGLKPGELDILDGSPPCQGFSTAGKRDFCDTRNQLFREYVRILQGLKPKVFVMENVSGMVKGKMKLIFAEILRELKGSGYRVKARLMNAMYYGVPQSRQRMIFVGVREDLGIEPSHPNPQTPPIPVKICPIKGDTPLLQGVELERFNHIPPGGNYQNLPKRLLNGSAKYSNFHRRLHPNKPSYTIGKEEHFSSGRFYHWSEPRRVSDKELQWIQSYPSDYIFIGNSHQIHERIGNSVPPLLTKAVAEHINKNILQRYKDVTGKDPVLVTE